MNTIAQISPASSVPAPPIPHSIAEWGVTAAIVVYLVKAGFELIKKKDADEAQLNSTLIQDLRGDRKEELQQIRDVVVRLEASYRQNIVLNQKMAKAITGIHLTHQQQARTNTELYAQLRQHERILLSLNEKLDRLDNERTTRNHATRPESHPHV